jgi:2-hydroxy-3-keto-5-methylthiopentenyl-1-phosphate phosphatase
MFEWLKNYLLQQEIGSVSKTQKQFVEWEKVQSAVILVGSQEYSTIKDFVKQTGKNIDIIVTHYDKTSETKDCFLSVNKKDFNFFGLPKPEVIQKLNSKTYDVLINADFNNSSFLKALTGLAVAKCKLGPESAVYREFFDISIQSNQQDFLKQALKYLMMIKS